MSIKPRPLKNKPLVEAIFELRWELQGTAPNQRDPHYTLLVGRIYDKLSKEYPHHEKLAAANIPEEIAAYLIQHRFRKGEDQWPLVQIGPGIITLNDTDGYIWQAFEKKVSSLIKAFCLSHPIKEHLQIMSLQLRYIDAIDFDLNNQDLFDFLSTMMKTKINLYDELFNKTGVSKQPISFQLHFTFPSSEPGGMVFIGFARGAKKNKDAIIWETRVQSDFESKSLEQRQILSWLKKAHRLSDDWFFEIIEGELLRRV